MALTRAQMEEIINKGGGIAYKGWVLTKISELPTQQQIDAAPIGGGNTGGNTGGGGESEPTTGGIQKLVTKVVRTNNLIVAHNDSPYVPWTTAPVNTLEAWTGDDPTVLTVPSNGLYRIDTNIYWQNNPNGIRRVTIYKGDFERLAIVGCGAADYQWGVNGLFVSAVEPLEAGDRIRIEVVQNSGVDLAIHASTVHPFAVMTKL